MLITALAGCTPNGSDPKIGENYRWEGVLFNAPVLIPLGPETPISHASANALFSSEANDYELYFTPDTKFSDLQNGPTKFNDLWRVTGRLEAQGKIVVASINHAGEMSEKDTALDDTLAWNRLDEARDLIEDGGDPNLVITERMLSSLCRHASEGEVKSNEAIRAAIKAGANINASSVSGVTPIEVIALTCFDHTLVEEAIARGANLSAMSRNRGRSLLAAALSVWHTAREGLSVESVHYMTAEEIEALNARYKREEREQTKVIDTLLKAGARLNEKESSCVEETEISSFCYLRAYLEAFQALPKSNEATVTAGQ